MGSPTRSIETAFQFHLAEFAEQAGVAVALPNSTYKRTTGFPYIKASFLPGEPSQATLGPDGSNRHVGIFQATLFWQEGKGMSAPGEMADEIVDHFARGTVLTQGDEVISITRAYAGPAMIEPGWLYIPITVQYYCYASN